MKRIKKGNVLVALITLSLVWTLGKTALEMHAIRKDRLARIERTDEEIRRLKKEIQVLEGEIEKSSSTEYVEKVAREDLGMVKPREIIFVDKNRDERKSQDLPEDLPDEEDNGQQNTTEEEKR